MRPPSRSAIALAAVAASLAAAHPARASDVAVAPGESIQAAVDDAQPGDTISLAAGTFRENVTITTDDLTLRGAGAGRKGTVLMPGATPTGSICSDPEATSVHGICIVGQVDPKTGDPTGPPVRDVTIEGLTVEGFTGHGIFAFTGEDIAVQHVRARANKGYGIVGFVLSGVRYVDNVAIGNGEPGFYVGDSPDAQAVVIGNTAIQNGIGGEGFGFLFRDASHGVVAHNKATRNCLGFIFLDSGFNPAPMADWTAEDNVATRNDGACPADPSSPEGLPSFSGTGILIAGARGVTLRDNQALNNRPAVDSAFSGGIVVASGKALGGGDPSDNLITRNLALHNRPADVVWDGTGTGNRFSRNQCATSKPAEVCGG
jgi:hypothetical protein